MPQVARPASDITRTSITGTFASVGKLAADGAGLAYGANNSAAVHEVRLGTLPDPVSSEGHVFRYRVAKTNAGTLDGGGNAVSVTVALRQGTTVIATDSAKVVTGAWTVYEFALSAAQADAITDYTNLRLRMTTTASGGTSSLRRGGAWSWCILETPSPVVDTPTRVTAQNTVVILSPSSRMQWTTDGVTFVAQNPTVTHGGIRLQVLVTASDARGALPMDGTYGFVNGPLMVPDGGTTFVVDPDAGLVLQPTFVRNDSLALQWIITEAVLGDARSRGWTP